MGAGSEKNRVIRCSQCFCQRVGKIRWLTRKCLPTAKYFLVNLPPVWQQRLLLSAAYLDFLYVMEEFTFQRNRIYSFRVVGDRN